MAVTPTEVLNDDIKDLKGDIREVWGKVDLVKEEVYRVGIAQAEMKGEFRLVQLLLMLVIAGIVGSLWQSFNLNARVGTIESKIDKLDSKIEGLEASILKILEQTKPPVAPQAPRVSSPAP